MAEWMSVSVAAATRAANVDALSSWSACSTSETSNARAASADGRLPGQHVQEVRRVAERRIRIDRPAAGRQPAPRRDERADLAGQPDGLAVVRLRRCDRARRGRSAPSIDVSVRSASMPSTLRQRPHRAEDRLGQHARGRQLRLQVAELGAASAAGRATAGSRPLRTTRRARRRPDRGCRSPDRPGRRDRRRGSRSPTRRRRRLRGRPWASSSVSHASSAERRCHESDRRSLLAAGDLRRLTSTSSPRNCWKIDISPM